MFKNYLKMSLRSLRRNKTYTTINIVGLSIAIACAIIAFINYDYARNYDAFHKNGRSIYHVFSIRNLNRQNVRYGIVPMPLGPSLRQDVPGIVRTVRMEWIGSVIRYRDRVLNENILYVDDGFFEMFTFPLKSGTANLRNPSQVLISEEYANKYFGQENPVGKTLSCIYTDGNRRELTVSGVVRKFPTNSCIRFDLLASANLLLDVGINKANDWLFWTGALFIQVSDTRALPAIQRQLAAYLQPASAANPRMSLSGFGSEPLAAVARNVRDFRNAQTDDMLYPATHNTHVLGMAAMGLLMLLLACFNFINIAIAFSDQRAREIGMRKVLGSGRIQLVWQFIIENILLCLVALCGGLVLAKLFLPAFNELYPFIHLSLHLAGNWNLILFLVAVLLATGVGAALYPALIISAPQPVCVLRGHFKSRNVGLAMRVLLTGQFALSIIMVIGSIAFAKNAEFNRRFDLGFQKTNIISILLANGTAFTALKNELGKNPDIESISGSREHIYFDTFIRNIRSKGQEREVRVYAVGFNFFETMGLRLQEGRFFNEQNAADLQDTVIVSAILAEEMSWTTALGQTLSLEDKNYRVIGIVNDIYRTGPWFRPVPVLFRLAKPEDFTWLQARVRPDSQGRTLVELRNVWSRLFQDQPFNSFYQSPMLNEAIQLSQNIKTNFDIISFIAIVLSASGFFALVSLHIASRTKELGMRKVLGAKTGQLMTLTLRRFIAPLFIAFLLGDIGGYFIIRVLMNSIFVYHTDITLFALIFADLIVGTLALAAVCTRVWKAANANPVDSLRYE
jgi:ABC-type antimicrobial peptide transport system permease subunit